MDDLRNKQRDEIRAMLVDHSRASNLRAEETLSEGHACVEKLFAGAATATVTAEAASGGNGAMSSISKWLKDTVDYDLPPEELAKLDREEVESRLVRAIEDRFRPEMRRLERALVLQILDSAWKEHLLAMDHLRSSVGLRGYAQVDPKVEYKREGMRQFETMWKSIGDYATDMIFRMEDLPENFVGSTWADATAIHEDAPGASEMAQQQQQAIDGSQSDRKMEPIRNRDQHVGRNDPCPCGSGKKYKQCCLRNR
jgi:preprotein translocase subunit SecA